MKLYFTLWANLCFENFSAGNSGHDEKVTVLELVRSPSYIFIIKYHSEDRKELKCVLLVRKSMWRETDFPVSGGLELKQVQESNILGQWPGRRLGTSLNRRPLSYHAEVAGLYLPGTVWKSVEQILILHIQDLNISIKVSYLIENFKLQHILLVFSFQSN